MKPFLRRIAMVLPLVALALAFVGCKTDDSDMAERPWNAPKSWETGLPSTLTEGR